MSINPQQIVKSLLKLSKARIYEDYEFTHFNFEKQKFELFFKEEILNEKFDVLIYALGADSKDFISYECLKLSKVRGQVTHLKPFLKTPFALSSKGYVCVAKDDLQVIGASYDRLNLNPKPLKSDDEANLDHINFLLLGDEKLEIIGSKVGFRAYSSDRFPIIGAFYDENFYKQAYKALLWNKEKPQVKPKNLPQFYLSSAHGSRGFSYAILAARYICALINDEPLGFYKGFVKEIHPARFLIRALKKGLIKV